MSFFSTIKKYTDRYLRQLWSKEFQINFACEMARCQGLTPVRWLRPATTPQDPQNYDEAILVEVESGEFLLALPNGHTQLFPDYTTAIKHLGWNSPLHSGAALD